MEKRIIHFEAFVESQKQVARNRYATEPSIQNICNLLNVTIKPLLEEYNPIFISSTDEKEFGKVIINKIVYEIVDSEQGRGLFIRNLY